MAIGFSWFHRFVLRTFTNFVLLILKAELCFILEKLNILKFLGCDEIKRKDGDGRLMLVLSYCPLGNLQEYLRKNTVDLVTFTKMALSVSTGLAYLHTEIHKQGMFYFV